MNLYTLAFFAMNEEGAAILESGCAVAESENAAYFDAWMQMNIAYPEDDYPLARNLIVGLVSDEQIDHFLKLRGTNEN